MAQITASLAAHLANGRSASPGTDTRVDGDAFKNILASRLRGASSSRGDRVAASLDQLASRFPGVPVNFGKVPEGVKGAKDFFSFGDKSDQVALDESILADMMGDGKLAGMVENAIAGFLDRDSAGNLMNFGAGAVAQRSLSISMTTIRYGEFHYSGETGELLAASELKTSFHDRLTELIQKFFGGIDLAEDARTETTDQPEGLDEASGKEDGTEAAAVGGKQPSGLPWGAASASVWSLEIYYSASFLASASVEAQGQNGTPAMAGAWEYRASYSASLMAGLTSNMLPQAAGRGDGALQSFLENALPSLGLEGTGQRPDEDGQGVTLRPRRNLLSELMELYEGKKRELAAV